MEGNLSPNHVQDKIAVEGRAVSSGTVETRIRKEPGYTHGWLGNKFRPSHIWTGEVGHTPGSGFPLPYLTMGCL